MGASNSRLKKLCLKFCIICGESFVQILPLFLIIHTNRRTSIFSYKVASLRKKRGGGYECGYSLSNEETLSRVLYYLWRVICTNITTFLNTLPFAVRERSHYITPPFLLEMLTCLHYIYCKYRHVWVLPFYLF